MVRTRTASRGDWSTTAAGDRRAWPMIVTGLMVLAGFVPGLGILNFVLFVPMAIVLVTIWLSPSKWTGKKWRDGLSWLFLIVAPLVTATVIVMSLSAG